MNPFNPYQRPKLMLLGVEECHYAPGVVITAHQVVDGAGNLVSGCNTLAEGEEIAQRYRQRYQDRKFIVE